MNYAIILAGGAGTRFWPLSREELPKQFLRIIGKNSLLEETIKRIRPVVADKNIFIITNQIYLSKIKAQIKRFNIPIENIILEPGPLNTLPAIALGAQIINLKDPLGNLLVLPSDHYIKDSIRFRQVISKALDVARSGSLCLIGIKPDSPCTGYGYIQAGVKKGKDAFYVKSFKEKPLINEAKRLFKKKSIFWNSGIFCFKSEVILREIQSYRPRLYRQIIRIKYKQDIDRIWHRIRPVSIDYGLLEKSKKLIMVTAKFYWRDLGSWDALCDVLPKERKNNIILSDSINLDSTNTFIYSEVPKRFIATVGLEDTIIVDTKDALLVCRKEKSQKIKKLVGFLKKKRKKCV